MAVSFNKMTENLRAFSAKEKNLVIMAEAAVEREKQQAKELVQVQMHLFHTSKLVTLGEMSAGIAHEINQPLAGIALVVKDFSMLMKNNKLSHMEIESGIKDIDSLIQRMTKIIHHIRTFARQDTLDFTNVNVHNTIDFALELLREQLRLRDIDIILNFYPDLPQIIGESYQLEQVWINLIINARDAIETKRAKLLKDKSEFKGQITIKTQLRGFESKQFVEINVSDNGIGMNKKQKEKAFEPFFTSKEVGKGIGLGLAISYGIIKNHKGAIELNSKNGKGAIIK